MRQIEKRFKRDYLPKVRGQHFLKNKTKLRKIVDALELKEGDVVIEIGPGHGELTTSIKYQVTSNKLRDVKIIAIEKDFNLASSLELLAFRNKWHNVEVVHGDALQVLPELTKSQKLKTKNYKIVGNIPYYITGFLLRLIGELEYKPSIIVFTIQKEVAERIVAKPPHMNLLAASVQFWAEPKIIGYISKKDFKPVPKVDSAIIRLAPYEIFNSQFSIFNYYRFIKILFKQPRKTIANNLTMSMRMTMTKDEIIKKLKAFNVNPSDRPQNLSIEEVMEMSRIFS